MTNHRWIAALIISFGFMIWGFMDEVIHVSPRDQVWLSISFGVAAVYLAKGDKNV